VFALQLLGRDDMFALQLLDCVDVFALQLLGRVDVFALHLLDCADVFALQLYAVLTLLCNITKFFLKRISETEDNYISVVTES
jgi:hypothetical protein